MNHQDSDMTSELKELNLFKPFVEKKVKIVYSDYGKNSLAKGVLKEVSQNFLLVRGDHSLQLIPLSSINKINHLIREGENDEE